MGPPPSSHRTDASCKTDAAAHGLCLPREVSNVQIVFPPDCPDSDINVDMTASMHNSSPIGGSLRAMEELDCHALLDAVVSDGGAVMTTTRCRV